MKTVKFKQWNCNVKEGEYSNERIALWLEEIETGEYIAKATVNVIEDNTSPDEVIIKDYSENEGMYESLLKAGIITEAHRFVYTGNVKCPVSFLKH